MSSERVAVIIPDTPTSESVVEILRKEEISDKNIYVIGKRRDEWVSADVLDSVAVGAMLSAALGILIAGLPIFAAAGGVLVATGAALGVTLLGTSIAVWLAGLLDTTVEDEQVIALKNAIDDGEIVVIADVPKERISLIADKVKKEQDNVKVQNIKSSKRIKKSGESWS